MNLFVKTLMLISIIAFATYSFAQSPKKYYKNGYYEKAFIEATKKQNKKIKLKQKHAQIIYNSYTKIYSKSSETIHSNLSDWNASYKQLEQLINYRKMVRHPLIADNLNDPYIDPSIQQSLVKKFNSSNAADIELAMNNESELNYMKALEVYEQIGTRHTQAEQIMTIKNRLVIIDYTKKVNETKQKIGDAYIDDARKNIALMTKQNATLAIDLIEKARRYRPLSIEEEELKSLANLIIGESWINEAKKLIATGTKKNARLAYELINRARQKKALNAEEEALLKQSEDLGTIRVLVELNGNESFNSNDKISGDMNKKSNKWVSFYSSSNSTLNIDYKLEITEHKPLVITGKTRKQITQNSKQVEYWEYEVNEAGDSIKVKKTRNAIALVAMSSKTKTACIDWSLSLKDLSDGKIAFSDSKSSKIELTHQFAALESGDILAMPENIETEVDLDSQPFPSDDEMTTQVKDLYLSDLFRLKVDQKIMSFE